MAWVIGLCQIQWGRQPLVLGVEGGGYVETRYDHSPENVSDYKTWSQERLTPDADRLSNALAVVIELYGDPEQ